MTIEWRAQSADGRTAIEQVRTASTCIAKCERNREPLWSSDCFATKDDFVFLTNDGEQVIVVVGRPPQTTPWKSTEVLRVYSRGVQKHAYSGGPMLAERDVRSANGAWAWLGERPPRYLRGAMGIEFETRTGRVTRVPFQGVVLGEERLESNRPETPDAPKAAREYAADPLRDVLRGSTPPTPAPQPAPAPATTPRAPNPDPRGPRTIPTTICSERGCYQVELPPPPPRDSDGFTNCKSGGEACYYKSECCSYACVNDRCQ